MSLFCLLTATVLIVHGLFILWVIFGAFLVGFRPVLRWFHVGSLAWGILTEVLYWPCPLTLAENALEQRAGLSPYHEGFIVHYLDKIIYPDISANVLTTIAVTVCTLNLGFYLWRGFVPRHAHRYEPRNREIFRVWKQ